MTCQGFLSIVIGLAAYGFASTTALAAGDTASVNAPSTTGAPAPRPSDSSPGWQLGLRAGWGMSVHGGGSLDSDLYLDEGLHLSARSGFSKAVNEVDLAVDVLTPWSVGMMRPFATFGVGNAVGGNESTGGITAFPTAIFGGGGGTGGTPPGLPEEIPGLTAASLKDRINFYTRVGGDFEFPMPGQGPGTSFHARPYVGFDLRAYTGTLVIRPSVLEPFVGPDLPPDQDVQSSFTRVSPLAGLEFVVPLCSHDLGGLDVYLGGEYQFNVTGNHFLGTQIDEGASAFAGVSGGGVARGFAGFQYHFRLGGN